MPYPNINRFLGAISISKKSGRRIYLRFTLGVCNLVTEKYPFLDGDFNPIDKYMQPSSWIISQSRGETFETFETTRQFWGLLPETGAIRQFQGGNFAIPLVS